MRKQSGFILLLELMIVCLIMVTLAAVALPSFVQMTRLQAQQQAKQRVLQVAYAEATITLCSLTPGCNPSSAFPLLPQQSVLQIGPYSYVFTVNGPNWNYVAVPQNSQMISYFIDQTGLLRCAVGSPANVGSLICN